MLRHRRPPIQTLSLGGQEAGWLGWRHAAGGRCSGCLGLLGPPPPPAHTLPLLAARPQREGPWRLRYGRDRYLLLLLLYLDPRLGRDASAPSGAGQEMWDRPQALTAALARSITRPPLPAPVGASGSRQWAAQVAGPGAGGAVHGGLHADARRRRGAARHRPSSSTAPPCTDGMPSTWQNPH
jgi:hypothetical protein